MTKTVNAKRLNFLFKDDIYRMDKYECKTIYVYKKIDGVYDFVSAREIIRQKLAELDPVNYSLEETAKPKYNTRILGAKLYELISTEVK